MKNIFKIKRHPHRSNEIPPPSSIASPSSSAQSPLPVGVLPSCASDHRAGAAVSIPSPSSPSPPAVEAARSVVEATKDDRQDYFSSEEEFQMQLALAISASNSEFPGDPDGDQIRAAKLLSLGRQPSGQKLEEGTAESLSRRYWDYNVLDYDEKVVDGFYDIFGLSSNSANQGKMPSLVDLQTIGDLGFEVIIVNRAIDPALVELEQVAQCIALDCPVAETGILVQRISELVMEHMGGPVRDANDMVARWMERSTDLRTSQQTSLLPIGCIKVGLSRHRALLFKVLADNVGILCRLVKGSHYTGVDDDAVDIIKLDNEREFLVDLMAAPGTLIPADVLSIKETAMNSYNSRVSKTLTPWGTNNFEDNLIRDSRIYGEQIGGIGTSVFDHKNALDRGSQNEKATTLPDASDYSGASSTTIGSSSMDEMSLFTQEQSDQSTSSAVLTSLKQKGVIEAHLSNENMSKEKLNAARDTLESRDLFADLNPFQVNGVGKSFAQYKATDVRNNGYQRRRENIALAPGKHQNPLVWKGRSACNELPNAKQNNVVEGIFPQKSLSELSASSQMPISAVKPYSEGSSDVKEVTVMATQYAGKRASDRKMTGTSTSSTYLSSEGNISNLSVMKKQHSEFSNLCLDSRADRSITSVQSSGEKFIGDNHPRGSILGSNVPHEPGGRWKNDNDKRHVNHPLPVALQNSVPKEPKEKRQNVNKKHDPKKSPLDRFMGTVVESEDPESSTSSQNWHGRIDPMLDDVAECEIPWEDLDIGERIGLGSYGEVYRADWNGKEVAVKKFLDQDFYGGALDEFRCEVRIMRRLRHPNVVLFMGAVTRPPNLSIITEFLPRGSLYRILHRFNCQIDEKRRIKMALDVAKGMNCLHTSVPTIVHRDLKSPNLLVDNDWTVKVGDFGLSRLKHSTFLSSKSTAGTPEWMAPEVLRNEPSNEKCDVYSFGVILWELATLRMPWSGMNPMQVVGAVGFQDRRLEIPKEVDPLVATVIIQCWQTDPSLRPSFAQLTHALKSLQRLVTHQETQSPPMPQEISVNLTP